MYPFFKRLIDIILSFLGLIILSPLWLITILGILVNDPGPIFYLGIRIGRDDKEFKMFKFRSMRVVKITDESSLRAEKDRIFEWGKVIRKFKIDEVPQLINIFIGDMSVVGPRPVAKAQFGIFRTGKYCQAKSVRPGLTGPAALYDYIYGDQFEDSDIELYTEKVLPTRKELELAYLHKMSFWFDLRMVFYTMWCVFCSLVGKTPKGLYDYLVKMAEEERRS